VESAQTESKTKKGRYSARSTRSSKGGMPVSAIMAEYSTTKEIEVD